MEKVFCENCKYIIKPDSEFNGQIYNEYLCKHPSNLNDSGNWLKEGIDFIAMPNEINTNNECPNFEMGA